MAAPFTDEQPRTDTKLSAPPGVFLPPAAATGAGGMLLSTNAPNPLAGHARRQVLLAEPRFAGMAACFAAEAKATLPEEKAPLPASLLAGRSGPLHARRRAMDAMQVDLPAVVSAEEGTQSASNSDEEGSLSGKPINLQSALSSPFGATRPVPPPGLAEPVPPSESLQVDPALPSVGSQGHALGICKPCAFVYKGGCESGVQCKFCHLCPPGVKKLRKKEWKEQRRVVRSGAPAHGLVCDPSIFYASGGA